MCHIIPLKKKTPAAKTEEKGQKEWEGKNEMRNRSLRERKQGGGRMRTQHAGELRLFYPVVYMC